MEFRIADTFTASLRRLTRDEQKAAKTTAYDLQENPSAPGLSFHKLDRAKDKNFWSVRVSADIRMIVHKTAGSMLLCYVDHHDRAYDWAERRKLETHPRTGAAQFVVIHETTIEIAVPAYQSGTNKAEEKPVLFADRSDSELLSYGVPVDWLGNVRRANEDTLLAIADQLPGEAAEALLQLATGGDVKAVLARTAPFNAADIKPDEATSELALYILDEDVFPYHEEETATPPIAAALSHPDAQRRFRLIEDREELERALEFPWEKWTTFLHPAQRQTVEREYSGPARVSGSAGTGKTIVALHRAVWLARHHPDSRVLLATFSEPLAHALSAKLRRLVYNEPLLAERIDVHSLDGLAVRLHRSRVGPVQLVRDEALPKLVSSASDSVAGHKFTLSFVLSEWREVVDAWQIDGWEAYKDVPRLGRKTRLPEAQRAVLWSIMEKIRGELQAAQLTTPSQLLAALTAKIAADRNAPFDFAVVDEAQDISVPQLRFLVGMGAHHPNGLFFAGDLGQRIFQQPFSWKSVGVDIRGRSTILRVNYRTSHQIRQQADRLLGPELMDIDGNMEDRRRTISVFNGPSPIVSIHKDPAAEQDAVATWLKQQSEDGVLPNEIGVFVRSAAQIDRARRAVEAAGMPFRVLDDHVETSTGNVAIGTMHLAKGLEFRAVVVMACDDEILPLQDRIQSIGDGGDLQEAYDTERHLLYVACTRARDNLLVTAVEPASEFLDDLKR